MKQAVILMGNTDKDPAERPGKPFTGIGPFLLTHDGILEIVSSGNGISKINATPDVPMLPRETEPEHRGRILSTQLVAIVESAETGRIDLDTMEDAARLAINFSLGNQ